MNIHYAIASILTTFISIAVGLVVFLKNKKSFINKSYFLVTLSTAVWAIGIYFHAIINNAYWCLFWGRFAHIGAAFIPVCFLQFILSFCGLYEKKKIIVKLSYLLAIYFAIIAFHPRFFTSVSSKIALRQWADAGNLYPFFIIFFLSYPLYALYIMLSTYKNLSIYRRNQLKYIIITSVAGFVGGSSTFLAVYGIRIYLVHPYALYLVAFYNIVITYAIVKYRLMDINVALTRAGIFTVVYALVLGVPFWLGYVTKSWLFPTAFMAVLATSGPFMYQYLRRRAEDVILKDQRRYQRVLVELSKAMARIRDLDKLYRTIVLTVVDTVKVSFAAIYLKDEEYKSYQLKHYFPKKEKDHFQEFIPLDYPLVGLLNQQKRPLLSEEIGYLDKINLDSGLVIPCFIGDSLLGFLVLGVKPNSRMYTPDDILIFEGLSYSTALAIENCIYWKEIEDRQRKARIQEMDTYSYSLGHEINNPMQTILGLSDILKKETLKDMPDGERRNDTEHSFDLILEAAHRVFGMVKAIRDFGAPVTGEAKPLAIVDAVESSIQLFLPQLKEKAINFEKILPKINHPVYVRGEKPELMQILMNFANNAMHALIDAPDKKITLKVELPNPDWVRISFSDTGYGIKKEKLLNIFAAFVTSKASTEGTGMGLYYAKKIIDKYKGKIWAESEGPEKGATFIVELPVAKDITEEELKRDDFKKKRLF